MARRLVSMGLVLALLVMSLAGCGGSKEQTTDSAASGKGPVEIEFWNGFTGPDGKGMANLVEEFNKEYEGKIKVTMQALPWGEYYDKIVTAVASNKAPEVGIIHLDNVRRYAARGILQPLDEDIKALGINGSEYLTAAWKAGEYEGHQYAIPLDFHPLALYYNIDLLEKAGFKEPPSNPDEFLQMLKATTKPEEDQWGIMVQVGWPTQMILIAAIAQNGGSLFTPDGQTPAYNSPEAVKALQFLADLIHKHKVSPTNVPVDGGVTAFKQGKAAFHIDGIWMMQGFKEQAGLRFGVAPVSSLFGTAKKAAWGGSHNFVLFKMRKLDAEKRKAALTFIQWIGKRSVEWAKWGQIPAHNGARNSEEFKALTEQSILAQQVDHAVFIEAPNNPYAPQGWDPVMEQMNLVLLGELDAKTALDKAVENGIKAMEAAKQGN